MQQRAEPSLEPRLRPEPARAEPPREVAQPPERQGIPNADLIQAVLDGKTVQVTPNEDGWTDMDPSIAVATLVRAAPGLKFRIKPQALVHWLPVYRNGHGAGVGNVYVDRRHVPQELPGGPVVKLIRLELDANSLELLSAKSEAP